VTVQATHRLPFTVSESGAGGESYEFSLDSETEVSVSLTGMDRDIDCSVNGARCTNRGGTADDSWSGRLGAGTHTVSVYPYNADSGSWTLSVSGTSTSPPPAPAPSPPGSPQPTCPSGYAYAAAASRCERSRSFRMQAIETGISSRQSYSFTLRSSSRVTVSLTGLTRDFDCRVKYSYCTNNWGSEDDSWSGTLGAGPHTVLIYPYGGGGPGDYTLTVAVNDVSLVSVVMPTGSGPEEIVCKKDGEEIDCPTPDENIRVVGEDPGPPPGAGPGEGDTGPGQTPDPGGGGGSPGGGTPTPSDTYVSSWDDVITTTDRCAENFDKNDRLGINHGGVNDTPGREDHSGVDIQGNDGDPVYAWRGGRAILVDNAYCGNGVDIHHDDDTETRYCHFNAPSSLPGHDNRIPAGTLIGHVGQTGRASGDHVHVTYTLADGETKIEYFSALPPGARPTTDQLDENGC